MLEPRHTVIEDDVGAARVAKQNRYVVGHAAAAPRSLVAAGANRQRVAMAREVPQREIEVVDRLFQQPGPYACRIVTPAVFARTIGVAEQADIEEQWIADRIIVDQRLDSPPLRRLSQLVSHRNEAPGRAFSSEQRVTVVCSPRNRLYEQHVLARLK